MPEKNPAAKAALLRLSLSGPTGVQQISTKLRLGPSTLIGLAAELQDEGLLEVYEVSTGNAGRPKKGMRVTALGIEYLRAYEALSLNLLKSRRADLRRAAEDGAYARRLAERRIPPRPLPGAEHACQGRSKTSCLRLHPSWMKRGSITWC